MLPYMHCTSQNLKKVASRHCPKISSAKKKPGGCRKKQELPYVTCAVAVAYELPFSCGKSYVGQHSCKRT